MIVPGTAGDRALAMTMVSALAVTGAAFARSLRTEQPHPRRAADDRLDMSRLRTARNRRTHA